MSWHTEDPQAHPYQDPAELIIEKHGENLNDAERADMWQTFHAAQTPEELAQKLQAHNAPNALKHELWSAKRMTVPQQSNADKVSEALRRVARLDPQVLELAEKYPATAKALIDAIKSGE